MAQNEFESVQEYFLIFVRCLCISCYAVEKTLKFHSVFYGRSKSCGCKKHELRKKTNLERYGVEHALQAGSIKQKIKKTNKAITISVKLAPDTPSFQTSVKSAKNLLNTSILILKYTCKLF